MKNRESLIIFIVISILAIGVIFLGVLTVNFSKQNTTSVPTPKGWTAVFLANGQVYFGKVSNLETDYVILKDIYYLKLNDKSIQPEAKDLSKAKIALIKLGKELHGPKDKMVINRDQVLFIEELNNDSRIVQSIEAYKNK